MAIFGEGKGNPAAKITLKEMSAFFLVLLLVIGVFSFVGYKYNSKVDTTVDGLLEQKGMSVLSASKAEQKAEKLEIEIKDAQYNLERVSGLLANEKSKLKRKKEAAINEVAALEEELELIDINSKRVSDLLDKERDKLETQKAAAIAEIAEKEAELKAENARVDKLYKEEMMRLEEKKQKVIDLVAAKNGEIEALEKGDTAIDDKETVKKNEKYRLDDDESKTINLSSASESKDLAELEGKEKLDLSYKEQNIAINAKEGSDQSEAENQNEISTQVSLNAASLKETTNEVNSFFYGMIKGFVVVVSVFFSLIVVGWGVTRIFSH